MHRPSFNFHTLLKSSLAALVIAAGLCSPLYPALALGCGGGATTDDAGNPCPAPAAPATVNITLAQDDDIFSTLASVASAGAMILGEAVVTVLGITIPLMQYQGFTSSLVVGAGWAIVRDVVNMFFVVILIVIAMMTIFGSSSVQWRQAVPKLMIMALVINFSKTLCGLMIDFSQVVMLTFANALKDIAGGNFIQLLGLGPILSLSPSSTATIGSFDLFAASTMALFMMVWVLAIVIMLMFILVYRIVMLWILIVVAPLAWFTKVVPFGTAKQAYSDWWKSFTCYCSVGPVITFFLWLTLAVAGAGSIASNDPGFSATGVAEGGVNPTGGLTQIFELEHLSSFVIGMALLVAGMDAAAKVCAGVAGAKGMDKLLGATKGGGFINQGAASVGKWAGKKGGEIGAKAAKGTGKAMYGLGAAVVGAGANEVMSRSGIKDMAASALRRGSKATGGMKYVPSVVSTKLGLMAGKVEESDIKAGKEAGKDLIEGDQETQIDYLNGVATARDGKAPMLKTERNKALAVYQAAVKDKQKRKAMEENGSFAKLQAMFEPEMEKAKKGSELRNTLKEVNRTRPDLGDPKKATERIAKITQENINEVDAGAFVSETKGAEFRAHAATIETDKIKSTQKDADGNETYTYYNELEAAENGWRGQEKKKALDKYYADNPGKKTSAGAPVRTAPAGVPSVGTGSSSTSATPGSTIPAPSVTSPARSTGMPTAGAVPVPAPTPTPALRTPSTTPPPLPARTVPTPAPASAPTPAPTSTPAPNPSPAPVPPPPVPPRRPPSARPTTPRPVTPAAGAPTTTTTTTKIT